MADTKISALNPASPLTGREMIPAVQDGFPVKVYVSNVPIYGVNVIEKYTNEINVDNLYPLSTGFYTLPTAIAAVDVSLRAINKKITFTVAIGKQETYQFTNSDIENWNIVTNWTREVSLKDIEKIKNIKDSDSDTSFFITDGDGNVIAKIDLNGINSSSFNILDSTGAIVANINKEFIDNLSTSFLFQDKVDGQSADVLNNYAGEFLISDISGNVIFKIDADGPHFSDSSNSFIFEEITSSIARIKSSKSYSKIFFNESKLVGKKILAIGDSLTAANKWQVKTAAILGATQVTHALGGGGIINFVDGGTTSSGTLAVLNAADVTGIDAIVILGPYNNRNLMSNIGEKTDMYPNQQTLWGQMNYLFKRIYEELTNANNLNCKIFFSGCHAYGAYTYCEKTAYQEYPPGTGLNGEDFVNKLKEICGWNGIQYIDLFHNSGINSYTWNTYQATPYPNAQNYIGYIKGRGAGVNDPFPDLTTLNNSIVPDGFVVGDRATVTGYAGFYIFNGTSFDGTLSAQAIWLTDQLHCNNAGYELIGNYIANKINLFINN